MSSHIRALPLQIDPLIAEARRRATVRRLVLFAVLIAAASGGTAFGRLRSTGGAGTASSPQARLATFVGHWFGHTRGIDITGSGLGREYLNDGARPVAALTFEVRGVTGTPTAADAQIRVTSVRIFERHAFGHRGPPRVGELGSLLLWNGIVTDSTTRVYFCAPKPAEKGVCGL
jgi:hypothetical protein